MSQNVSELLAASMEKVRNMVDSNTVVGAPITVSESVTVIPVSKITFGLASGGTDIASKADSFGGGTGCGVRITPVCFIVVQKDTVRVLPVETPPVTAAERVIEQIPDLVDKLTALLSKKEDIADI